jgi:hypothetical protein
MSVARKQAAFLWDITHYSREIRDGQIVWATANLRIPELIEILAPMEPELLRSTTEGGK